LNYNFYNRDITRYETHVSAEQACEGVGAGHDLSCESQDSPA
jgi:hypothetical protein